MRRDLVKSYVYYLRAAASEVATVKTAALAGAAEVGGTMTDVQHASARDMLIGDSP